MFILNDQNLHVTLLVTKNAFWIKDLNDIKKLQNLVLIFKICNGIHEKFRNTPPYNYFLMASTTSYKKLDRLVLSNGESFIFLLINFHHMETSLLFYHVKLIST